MGMGRFQQEIFETGSMPVEILMEKLCIEEFYIEMETNRGKRYGKKVWDIWAWEERYILRENNCEEATEMLYEHHPDWMSEGERVIRVSIDKHYKGGKIEPLMRDEMNALYNDQTLKVRDTNKTEEC